MNKEELSNAISDYQKLCRGNYGTILDEIERKQNELNIILKSIEFAKKTSATQEEINDLLEQAKVLQSEIDKLWRQKNKMAKKYIAIRELLSNAAVSKIQRASSEDIARAKKLEQELNWEKNYGTLSDGYYRIVKKINNKDIVVEFEIESLK